MKIAIFGGTGFVGSYIIDELLKYDNVNEIIIVENKLHDISDFVKSTYSFVENTFKFVEQKKSKRATPCN